MRITVIGWIKMSRKMFFSFLKIVKKIKYFFEKKREKVCEFENIPYLCNRI